MPFHFVRLHPIIKMIRLLLIAILCFTVVTAIEGQCPPAPLLRPCTCISTAVETYVTCDRLKGQSDFDQVLARTPNDTFDHIEITRSKLVSIPAWSLETKRFTSLRIVRSSMFSLFSRGPDTHKDLQMVSIPARSLETATPRSSMFNSGPDTHNDLQMVSIPARSLETTIPRSSMFSSGPDTDKDLQTRSQMIFVPTRSLETISPRSSMFSSGPDTNNDLQSVTLERVTFLEGLDWSQFEKLLQVERIVIRDVSVPELDESFRKNVSTMLKFFVLKRTNTSRLYDKVFSLMPDLADIRIEKNRIRTLKRSMFPITNSIQTLIFNDNEIDSLPEDMFRDMPHLLRIGLRNNRISRVSKNVFGQAYEHLIALILEGNPINCDCSIKWLTSRDHHSKYVTGSCTNPSHVLGKEIADLTVGHFVHCG